jgi:hypothetical protein
MLSRTTTAKAAAAATVVGVLAWFGTRPETRRKARKVRLEAGHRSRLVRNVVHGRPVVAFATVHGTIDLTGTDRAAVHGCKLIGRPHPSGAAVVMGGRTVLAAVTDSHFAHFGTAFAAAGEPPAGPGGDAPTGGDQAETPREAALREVVAKLLKSAPIRHLPEDEQAKAIHVFLAGMYRALREDLGRQAAETAGPADETPAPCWGVDTDATPEV